MCKIPDKGGSCMLTAMLTMLCSMSTPCITLISHAACHPELIPTHVRALCPQLRQLPKRATKQKASWAWGKPSRGTPKGGAAAAGKAGGPTSPKDQARAARMRGVFVPMQIRGGDTSYCWWPALCISRCACMLHEGLDWVSR